LIRNQTRRSVSSASLVMAARRSELVALDVADLEECPEGLRVTIRRSKTDREGAGAVVAVCRGSIACPVTAVLAATSHSIGGASESKPTRSVHAYQSIQFVSGAISVLR
jgi:hypothetical protein